jgi:hypothetical protein
MQKNFWMLILIIFMLSACTQKNNPVGYDPEDEPLKFIKLENNIISNVYSYEDTVKCYMNATVMSLGNRGKYESQILMRFYDLPDSLAAIEDAENMIQLKLVVNKQRNCENSTIRIHKLNQSWDQDYISWKAAADTTDWVSPYYGDTECNIELNGIYAAKDTVEILLPLELFYNQSGEKYYADSLAVNYGIMLEREVTDESGEDILEFYSFDSSSEYRPALSFNYKIETSDEEYTAWSSSIIYDGMLYNSRDADLEDFEVYADSLILRNISPTKMFIGLDIGAEAFISGQDSTGINDEADFNRMTINKAILVLQAKSDKYLSDNKVVVMPYLMTDTNWVATPAAGNIPVYDEQFEYISGTSTTTDSLKSGIYRINITKAIQAYISDGDGYTGFGLVLFSSRENRDFSIVRFYNQFAEDLKRPYIEIYYTPPLQ